MYELDKLYTMTLLLLPPQVHLEKTVFCMLDSLMDFCSSHIFSSRGMDREGFTTPSQGHVAAEGLHGSVPTCSQCYHISRCHETAFSYRAATVRTLSAC